MEVFNAAFLTMCHHTSSGEGELCNKFIHKHLISIPFWNIHHFLQSVPKTNINVPILYGTRILIKSSQCVVVFHDEYNLIFIEQCINKCENICFHCQMNKPALIYRRKQRNIFYGVLK